MRKIPFGMEAPAMSPGSKTRITLPLHPHQAYVLAALQSLALVVLLCILQ